MSQAASPQTHGFQAEVKQLLHLMVHSLYSEREIFLRELISNASDANDKLRFAAIARPELLGADADLVIDIEIDGDDKRLIVRDNGIGMSRDEIVEQLGTIAHSGTSRYLEQLTGDQRKDARLIGQFGVGFYSAFIVADEVEVLSRRADLPADQGVRWTSAGRGEFLVETVDRPERGTEVRLRLKGDAGEFLDDYRVRSLIRKYSDHIGFPVRMRGAGAEQEGDQLETVNHAQALWSRPRNEVSEEEYLEFYKHVTHDFAKPLVWSHNRVEGKREYTSLLYIPSVAPVDLWNREAPKGVKLYVQRVFITDRATYFLPLYLRFVRGVVDARDLSLNVSRELLQEDPHVAAIRSALTKRVLTMLDGLASKEPEKYRVFWSQFGYVLKEGLAEDAANKDAIADLLRFASTRSEGDAPDRSLREYVTDAKEDQPQIYYLVSDSVSIARSSPHLEIFKDRGIEVLFLSDRIDEWMLQFLTEYAGKTFRDVTRGELDLGRGSAEAEEDSQPESRHELAERVKTVLADKVSEVRMSTRLKESPACLVLGDQDLGYQMREMLRAAGHEAPESAPTLELNPTHPLVKRLEGQSDERAFERLSLLILDQAILAEGRQLSNPSAYISRLNEFFIELGLEAAE